MMDSHSTCLRIEQGLPACRLPACLPACLTASCLCCLTCLSVCRLLENAICCLPRLLHFSIDTSTTTQRVTPRASWRCPQEPAFPCFQISRTRNFEADPPSTFCSKQGSFYYMYTVYTSLFGPYFEQQKTNYTWIYLTLLYFGGFVGFTLLYKHVLELSGVFLCSNIIKITLF
jgi:hypothetical protein